MPGGTHCGTDRLFVLSTSKTSSAFSRLKEGHLYILKTEEFPSTVPWGTPCLVPCKRKNIYTVWSLCNYFALFRKAAFNLSGRI
jgi:hypothetical protein